MIAFDAHLPERPRKALANLPTELLAELLVRDRGILVMDDASGAAVVRTLSIPELVEVVQLYPDGEIKRALTACIHTRGKKLACFYLSRSTVVAGHISPPTSKRLS